MTDTSGEILGTHSDPTCPWANTKIRWGPSGHASVGQGTAKPPSGSPADAAIH